MFSIQSFVFALYNEITVYYSNSLKHVYIFSAVLSDPVFIRCFVSWYMAVDICEDLGMSLATPGDVVRLLLTINDTRR